jgi:hypothetical protein
MKHLKLFDGLNIKFIKILIPNDLILKKINSTPALKNLTRLALKVGENIENVNHYQFSQLMRMFPIAGAFVEEVKTNEGVNLFGFAGDDRKKILEFMGINDWAVLMRKFNNRTYRWNRYEFENAIKTLKLSIGFIREYKDLYSGFISDILRNKNYTTEELIFIINKFPENVDWYYVFYNDRIPIEFKKEHYDEIYRDMLTSFDINVPMDVRERNSKKALEILK